MTIQDIEALALQALLDRDKVLLIDVREENEYAGERISDSAHFFPLSDLDVEGIRELHRQNSQKQLVLYCKAGKRSFKAGEILLEAGVSHVSNLVGGILAWKEADLPTSH